MPFGWVDFAHESRGSFLKMSGYKFVIADDHPLFRDALTQTLMNLFEDACIDGAGSLDEVMQVLNKNKPPDLILLDLKMPGVQGFSGLSFLRAQYPGLPVIVVSANEEPSVIRRAMDFGASGFIPKSSPVETMRAAVSEVLNGGIWVPENVDLASQEDDEVTQLIQRFATLTPQQLRVLMMLREGLLNKQIAYELSVSEATVKAHVSAILQKLSVESRTQAVIAASRIDGEQWNDQVS
jgi:DNA-binding NarL/FixJ family response regulator